MRTDRTSNSAILGTDHVLLLEKCFVCRHTNEENGIANKVIVLEQVVSSSLLNLIGSCTPSVNAAVSCENHSWGIMRLFLN